MDNELGTTQTEHSMLCEMLCPMQMSWQYTKRKQYIRKEQTMTKHLKDVWTRAGNAIKNSGLKKSSQKVIFVIKNNLNANR